MKTNNFQKYFLYKNRYIFAYTFLILLSLFTLFYRLGVNPYGIATVEAEYILSITDGSILADAINLPHKLMTLASINLLGASALSFRIPSVIFGLIFTVSVFTTFSLWHKKRIAIIATILAVSSSWFLNISRLGTDYVALPTVIMLFILAIAMMRHSSTNYIKAMSLVFIFAFVLYTPLTLYILVLFAILYRKEIANRINLFNNWEIAGAFAFLLLLLSPLIYTFILNVDQLLLWLGVEGSLPTIGEFLKNLKFVFSYIFWQSNENILLHIKDLPMLNIFTATMTALGLYHYEKHNELLRTRFALWGILITIIMAAFTGKEEHIIMTWPFILIFAATGVVTLLTQWYKIFPNNPVARVSALIPLSVLVLFSVLYNMNRFFVAWPNQENIYTVYQVEGEVLTDAKDNQITILTDDESKVIINSYFLEETKPEYEFNNQNIIFANPDFRDQADLSKYQKIYEIYHPVIKDQVVFEVFSQNENID